MLPNYQMSPQATRQLPKDFQAGRFTSIAQLLLGLVP